MRKVAEDNLQRLVDVWNDSDSLKDAIKKAGYTTKDPRRHHRLRRQAENLFGIQLEPHNPENSTDIELNCPSTLDMKKLRKHKSFVFSSYVNNGEIVSDFLTAIEKFCKAKKAHPVIKPVRYKNPNAMSRDEQYVWDERIIPYALVKDFHVNQSLVFSAQIMSQATTVSPLAGLDDVSGKKSLIVGHTQLAMRYVATPKDELPKLLLSTGCITKPRYSFTIAGAKARQHHSISAVYVVKVGKMYRKYILEWDGNGFSFFNEYWTAEGKSKAKYKAIHLGDGHAESLTESVIKSREKAIKELNPEYIIHNDVHSQAWQSHHNTPIEMAKYALSGKYLVEDEIMIAVNIINRLGKGRKNLIIRSNHHDHLDGWLNRFNPKTDPHNLLFYNRLMAKTLESDKSPLELAMEDHLTVDYEFVSGNSAYMIAGIDVSQHGDKGVNGARSAQSLAKSVYKKIVGHTHSPFILFDLWCSGAMEIDQGYNNGYGSHMSTDTLITETGSRAQLDYIKNKYWV